jgi:hypothetical protein
LVTGELFEIALVDLALVAGDANGGAARAGHGMWAEAELFNVFADGGDLLRCGLGLHDDEHGETLLRSDS